MSSVNLSNVLMRTQQSRITWGEAQKTAFVLLILPVFRRVLERSLVWCCLSLPVPKLGQKVLLLLSPFSSKHAPTNRRCRVVKQWEVKPNKIVNALQAMLLFGLVRFVPGTSEQIHLTSVPTIVVSTPRRHILRCCTIVFASPAYFISGPNFSR